MRKWLRPLPLTLLASALVVLLVNLLPHAPPADQLARVRLLEQVGEHDQARHVLEKLVKRAPDNADASVLLMGAVSSQRPADLLRVLPWRLERRFDGSFQVVDHCGRPLERPGLDMAFFLTAEAYSDADPARAVAWFHMVGDRHFKGLNAELGWAFWKQGKHEQAIASWKREIALGGDLTEAVSALCKVDLKRRDVAALAALSQNPRTAPFVSLGTKAWLAWHQGRPIDFLRFSLTPLAEVPFVVCATALLIAAMWLLYFHRIDLFEPEPVWALLCVFCMGMLSGVAVIVLGRESMRSFWSILGSVGGVEELVKFVPVVIFAAVSHQIDEPVDYLIYGSVSALGFSTVENMLYFKSYAFGDVVFLRFILSVVVHMWWTSLICYAWARARWKGRNPVWPVLGAYLLAVVLHAIYDYNSGPVELGLALIGALIYGRLLGNALGFSPFYHEFRGAPSASRLRNGQLIGSVAVLMFILPFLYWNFHLSTEAANAWLGQHAGKWLLVLFYFLTVDSLSPTRGREEWLIVTDEAGMDTSTRWRRSIILARAMFLLVGSAVLVTPLFAAGVALLFEPEPVLRSLLAAGALLTIPMIGWVYVRGAYGSLPSAGQLHRAARFDGWSARWPQPLHALLGRFRTPPGDFENIRSALAQAGFVEAPSDWLGAMTTRRRRILLAGMVCEQRRAYALLSERRTLRSALLRRRTACTLWSILDGSRGHLLSSDEVEAGLVPGDRAFVRVLPRGDVQALLVAHQSALDWLQAAGVTPQKLDAGRFEMDFLTRAKGLRHTFLAAPVRGTLLALRYLLARRRRYRRPLAEQPEIVHRLDPSSAGSDGPDTSTRWRRFVILARAALLLVGLVYALGDLIGFCQYTLSLPGIMVFLCVIILPGLLLLFLWMMRQVYLRRAYGTLPSPGEVARATRLDRRMDRFLPPLYALFQRARRPARDAGKVRARLIQAGFVEVPSEWLGPMTSRRRRLLLAGMVCQERRVYALLTERPAVLLGLLRRRRTDFLLWSVLQGQTGHLVTTSSVDAGMVPGRTSLLQIFPRDDVSGLLERHQAALEWLAGAGVTPEDLDAGRFQEDFSSRARGVRHTFLLAPIRNTALALWYLVVRRRRYRRPVADQPQVVRRLEARSSQDDSRLPSAVN